ncbi:MAG: glycine--tRNA ligase subunit beta [Xanthomonadales bacterium]|jgi:glycyl-tRNA synthetase beta chain|nr:glycine--tRNA ligase subunit beta [Xanthomonadales bacterium]
MSTSTAPLLFELGCEELPAHGLGALAEALGHGILDGLAAQGIVVAREAVEVCWTPRRLALIAPEVPLAGPARTLEKRGPALAAGRDAQGAPSRALQGFAASVGVPVEALGTLRTDKGEWFVHREEKPGVRTADVLVGVIEAALKALPIPKPMRWGDGTYSFLRPVHWVLLTLDDDVVPGQLFGIETGDTTRGHRFHAPAPITVCPAADYVQVLADAKVLVRMSDRVQRIRDEARVRAVRTGGSVDLPEALVQEVANLTEWPVPVLCEIPLDYMRLPAATLTTTIQTHQRFFPVRNSDGCLLPWFVGVANLESSNPAEIRKGYERVVRPRLADAAFFFDQDLKTPLAEHQQLLKSVAFQAKLGTLWEKSERVASLAELLAPAAGVSAADARAAALLSKCDLMTRMVGEFPELQGVMGRTYALAQGEPEPIAIALDEVYAPRGAGQPIAESPLGQVLAIAERLDTLACSFAIGARPSGTKDPYSLRRAALGLARTLIEGGVRIDLMQLFEVAVLQVPAQTAKDYLGKLSQVLPESGWLAGISRRMREQATAPAVLELYAFVLDRLRAYYTDRGVPGEVFEAVADKHPHDLVDFDQRVQAVTRFQQLPEAADLAGAFKRARNLLKKAEGEHLPARPDPVRFEHAAERDLFAELELAHLEVDPLLARADYVAALARLAQLQPRVAAFFDAVMVMVDDTELRSNRLALLHELTRQCSQVADLSTLAQA